MPLCQTSKGALRASDYVYSSESPGTEGEISSAALEGSGASIVQLTPVGAKLIWTFPPRSCFSPNSMRREPKPRREGGLTGGPPTSVQRMVSRREPFIADTFHSIVTRPFSVDRAPYFTAFVHSSCSAIASASAYLAGTETSGPSISKRSRS